MKVSAGPGGTAAPPAPFARSRRFSPLSPQLRARDPASRGDRYMLVTFDEPPYCIKVILPPRGRPGPPAAAPAPPRGRPWRGGGAAPSGPAAAAAACEDGGHFAFVWRREAEGAAEMEEGGGGDGRERDSPPRRAEGGGRPPALRLPARCSPASREAVAPAGAAPRPQPWGEGPGASRCRFTPRQRRLCLGRAAGARGWGGRQRRPRACGTPARQGAGEPPAASPPPPARPCFLGQRCQELLTASARQEAAASVGVGGSPRSFLRL